MVVAVVVVVVVVTRVVVAFVAFYVDIVFIIVGPQTPLYVVVVAVDDDLCY